MKLLVLIVRMILATATRILINSINAAENFYHKNLRSFEGILRVAIVASSAVWLILEMRLDPYSQWSHYAFLSLSVLCIVNFFIIYGSILHAMYDSWIGKVAYVVTASLVIVSSKAMADYQIRGILKSNPALFPDAQNTLTVYWVFIFVCVIGELGITIVVLIRLLFQHILSYRMLFYRIQGRAASELNSFVNMMTIFITLTVIAYLPSGLDVGVASTASLFGFQQVGVVESLLIYTTFSPNDLGEGETFCSNIPLNAIIAPTDTSNPMPDNVLVGMLIQPSPHHNKGIYSFSVEHCENKANHNQKPG